MIWLTAIYLAAGMLACMRVVPWGERTYYVGRFRGMSWQCKWIGALTVAGLVTVLWPLYVWAYCRATPAAELELYTDTDAAADPVADAVRSLSTGDDGA